MNQFTKIIFCTFLNITAFTQTVEKIGLEIPLQNSKDSLKIEISKVSDLETALVQIEKEAQELTETTDIIIANDFGLEKNPLSTHLQNNDRFSLIPLKLKEKVAAVETIEELKKLYPDKRYETLPSVIEQHYKNKRISYEKLRAPVTLIKSVGVGVANFALYYSKFDNHFIPAFIWALTTATQAAAFQWKAPEINNDYRIITDAFFNKFEGLKRFAVPEFDDGSGRFKIRHRIVKNLGVMFVGGWCVTNLYHFLSTAVMFSILANSNPSTLLNIVNEQSQILGIHFQSLTLQALGVGFLVNQFTSSIKELLSDVAPSCLLSSQLQKLSPEKKQIAMAIGSAFIGGIATILVSASQFLLYPGIKEAIWTLTLSGAAYSTYKYALKDFFSEKFLKEISNDFDNKFAKYFLSKIKIKKEKIRQASTSKKSCRILLIAAPPKGFLSKML